MTTLLIIIFIVGYLGIALEHNIKVDKSASALITGVLCWTVYIMYSDPQKREIIAHTELYEHVGEIAGILFFLLGAMTIVELIDAHEGFEVITSRIKTKEKIKLLWISCFLTFFLSALLDNLTTTIVMISILRKLVKARDVRIFFVGMVIISANAGGAWSPIGDVTTTMLWIGGEITTYNIIKSLLIPSLVCMIVPLLVVSFGMRGKFQSPEESDQPLFLFESKLVNMSKASLKFVSKKERITILTLGVCSLVFVPIFKTLTHLPPFMGILLSLGFLWLVTEVMHRSKNTEIKNPLSVMGVIQRVDVPSVLFFFGILIAIAAPQETGILKALATLLDNQVGNIYGVGIIMGLLSAVVDNVPIVAAAMGMYDVTTIGDFSVDGTFWQFLAYCAGTGGSALIIGSAAGVAAMGMERIEFGWYMKKISWLALIGYLSGAATYIAGQLLL